MSSSRLVGLSSLLLFAVACGSGYQNPSPAPDPAPAPGGTGTPVTIQRGAEALGDRAYAPPDLNVAVGTTVTWTNGDNESHTSDSDAPKWSSGIIGPGRTFSVVFDTAGTFTYHCSIHPGMVGRVTVR